MSVEQWVALAGVAALVITAIAGLTKAIGDLVGSFRRPDKTPAPEVGIPVPVDHDDDEIDYRAYIDMRDDRDYWRARAEGREPPTT